MKRVTPLLTITFALSTLYSFSQNDTILELHRSAYTVFELARSEAGIYRDSKLLSENSIDYHPASSAATGAGLIAEVIAFEMEWVSYSTAEENILTTLKTITGNNPEFNMQTNASGYPLHWFDMLTGEPMWTLEYSTIDAAILTCGVLFAREAFCNNDSIVLYAEQFWESIDWSEAIQNPETGAIYRLMEDNGVGMPNSSTLPFNEYMIVAWLALNQANSHPDSSATMLWNNHYADPNNLLTIDYEGIDLLTDNLSNYLSSFVSQFTYYYCHYYSASSSYLSFLENARKADSLWWALNANALPHYWGLGAGHCYVDPGYCVGSINDNVPLIYSPHIIAGFLPVYSNAVQDLLSMYEDGPAIYALPAPGSNEILWRRSLANPPWRSDQVQLIDFSTMLFGLTEYLKPGFFTRFNNFFENNLCDPLVSSPDIGASEYLKIFPNPTVSDFRLSYSSSFRGPFQLSISNNFGQVIYRENQEKNEEEFQLHINAEDWPPGVYYLVISTGQFSVSASRLIVHRR